MSGSEIDLLPLTLGRGADRYVEFDEALPAGWYCISFRADSKVRLRPAIVADWGSNDPEPTRLPLGLGRQGAYEGMVYFPVSLRRFRLKLGFDSDLVAFTAGPAGLAQRVGYIARLAMGAFSIWPPAKFLFTVKTRRGPGSEKAMVVHPFPRKRGRKQGNADYERWIEFYDYQHNRDADELRQRLAALVNKPLISIVMSVYNTDPEILQNAISSVRNQVYENWELCIADDCSDGTQIRSILSAASAEDRRIKVVFRDVNGHTAAASNSAFDELATGEWTVLLDHDDVLRPHALGEVALAADAHSEAELIYSDEDKIDRRRKRFNPYFKPQFSWELFRGQNYLNHLSAIRSFRIREVGGWREGFRGCQDYDLYLRVIERIGAQAIHHIPKVLYHWRMVEGSASEEPGLQSATQRALREHIERMELDYHVEEAPGSIYHRVGPNPPQGQPLVSIIIPTRDYGYVLEPCVDSIIAKTTYPNFEILIIDNDTTEAETVEVLRRFSKNPKVSVHAYPGPFNFPAINNFGVGKSRGEIVVLVNNDIEVISPDWLTELASWAALPEIGCVGAKLYYEHGAIQHAGVITGIGAVAGHGHKWYPGSHSGYFGRLRLAHNVSAVTGACLAIRRAVYDELGGLDEDNLGVAFNDVDLGLKAMAAGYRNVLTPHAELYHKESVSRGYEDTPEKQARLEREAMFMQRKWGAALENDPFYSPNLTLEREDFSLR